MVSAMPLHRFEEFGLLTPSEEEAVIALGGQPTAYPRHHTIRSEGDPAKSFFLLLEGWAIASMMLPDGRRQILKVHLPGDALGSPSMCSDRAIETLTALSPVVVSAVPLERFGELLSNHPRLGAYFLLSVQHERASLMEQLASMGRTTAEARLAALLLDLAERLEPIGAVENGRFKLLLTQEQIGDVLGLTGVHVNRTFRGLEKRRLIDRDQQTVRLLDRAGLARLAARRHRVLRTDLSWLPASRQDVEQSSART